jgi:hypothetical protein
MAKKLSEAALKNVLEMAAELLQEAEEADGDGMVTVSNRVYMRLRAAVKEATGIAHGMPVDDESDLDEEDEEEDDDEDQPDEDDN